MGSSLPDRRPRVAVCAVAQGGGLHDVEQGLLHHEAGPAKAAVGAEECRGLAPAAEPTDRIEAMPLQRCSKQERREHPLALLAYSLVAPSALVRREACTQR